MKLISDNFQVHQGREHTLYSVQTTRDVSEIRVEFLADSISSSL